VGPKRGKTSSTKKTKKNCKLEKFHGEKVQSIESRERFDYTRDTRVNIRRGKRGGSETILKGKIASKL